MSESAPSARGSIPPPRLRFVRRLGLPLAILVAAVGATLWSARDALGTRPLVTVASLRESSGATADAASVAEEGGGASSAGAPVTQASGWVEADPYATNATALIDGIVRTVDVLEGARVRAGDVLATLVDDDARLAVLRAGAEVQQADAELEVARAQHTAAQTEWENPVALERDAAVAKARLDVARTALAQQVHEIARERAILAERVADRDRLRDASTRSAVTPIELVRSERQAEAQAAIVEIQSLSRQSLEAEVAQAEAEHRAAARDLELRVALKRGLSESAALVRRAEAGAARARAALGEAELRMSRTVIRAPIDGAVMARLRSPGDKVMLGSDMVGSAVIVRLYDPAHLQVRVDVPLADASLIHEGQRAIVAVEILPDRKYEGVVTRITREADIQKNTLQVKVRIEDPTDELRPEMLSRVQFLGEAARSRGQSNPEGGEMHRTVMLVPAGAVRDGGSAAPWTLVVRERHGDQGVIERCSLEVISRDAEGAVVRGALRVTDLLVVDETPGAGDGEKVQFRFGTEKQS